MLSKRVAGKWYFVSCWGIDFREGVRDMKRGLCFRLSAGRLLAGVAAGVCLLLGADALTARSGEAPAVFGSPFEQAMWLKDRGCEVDPDPVWEKTIFLPDPPGEGEAAYLAALEEQGFSPREHLGRALTLTCFRLTGQEPRYARVLTDGGVLVGADRFLASPEADPFLPVTEKSAS